MNLANHIYEQGYHIIDHFLDDHHFVQLQQMVESLAQQGDLQQAKIGHLANHVHNTTIRRDKIHWIDENQPNESIQAYIHHLKLISQSLNETLFLGLHDFEAHFAVYQPGDFYKKHVDQLQNTNERRISCVYYLNDGWNDADGGELKLYAKQGALIANISPERNRFVCFSSDILHEVCVTSRKRCSIAAWLKVRKI